MFCTWLIREWNFAYLHHIHIRESPSEVMWCGLIFLHSYLGGVLKFFDIWLGLAASSNVKEFQYSSSVTVQEYPKLCVHCEIKTRRYYTLRDHMDRSWRYKTKRNIVYIKNHNLLFRVPLKFHFATTTQIGQTKWKSMKIWWESKLCLILPPNAHEDDEDRKWITYSKIVYGLSN